MSKFMSSLAEGRRLAHRPLACKEFSYHPDPMLNTTLLLLASIAAVDGDGLRLEMDAQMRTRVVATCGVVKVEPNFVTAVPGSTEISIGGNTSGPVKHRARNLPAHNRYNQFRCHERGRSNRRPGCRRRQAAQDRVLGS